MRRDYTVFVRGENFDVSVAVRVHSYGFPGAPAVHQVPGDDVAVDPAFQAGEQGPLEVVPLIVERDESAITATKGDLIAAVVPPVVDRGSVYGVAKDQHVVDLTPPVLADPTVAAGVVRPDDRGQYVSVVVRRWTFVEVSEIEGAHYFWISIIMRQHKSDRHLQRDTYFIERDSRLD